MSSARDWWLSLAADMERRPATYCRQYEKGKLWFYEYLRNRKDKSWNALPTPFKRVYYEMQRQYYAAHIYGEGKSGFKPQPAEPVSPTPVIETAETPEAL